MMKLILGLVIFFILIYFYPAQVIIHYPHDKPINIELIQYDGSISRAKISDQTKLIALKKSNFFTWHFTENQFAELIWWFDDNPKTTSRKGIMIGDVIEYLNACRIDVHLNEAAEIEDVKIKETQLLRFCF